MHELSLAQGMVEQLEAAANAEKALRVIRVVVALGPYAGVERESLAFAFPFAAEGTLAAAAELVVETVPARVACSQCGAVSHPEPTLLRCMACGSDQVRITGGHEFHIVSVELEVPPTDPGNPPRAS